MEETHMKVGVIGYGSMGKMLLHKFHETGRFSKDDLLAANRTSEKLKECEAFAGLCDNKTLASSSDIVFVCVRPVDMRAVLEEIKDSLRKETLLISLNGSITFEMMGKVVPHKTAKVIPSLTAEIGRSQTIVCYNDKVSEEDKKNVSELLGSIGKVIELPEDEVGMGSELVSCMPGFIASIFDVICRKAKEHTSIPKEQVVEMVLNTMSATGDLMLQSDMTFEQVVERVATKGGITEEGTKVIYEMFPEAAGEMFEKTLEKRRITAQKAADAFSS